MGEAGGHMRPRMSAETKKGERFSDIFRRGREYRVGGMMIQSWSTGGSVWGHLGLHMEGKGRGFGEE